MQSFGQWIEPCPVEEFGDNDPWQVMQTFRSSGRSAPGPDAWRIEDLRHMTISAARRLAALYDMVEMGFPWPQQLSIA
eukprot:11199513-Alexandrium_andersonii.AAC.1